MKNMIKNAVTIAAGMSLFYFVAAPALQYLELLALRMILGL